MSTILDALRKAKEAPPKGAAAEPRREILSMRTHDYLATASSPDEDRLRLLRWLIAAVAAVAVLLGVLVAVVLTRGGGARSAQPTVAEHNAPGGSEGAAAVTSAPVAAALTSVAATPAAAAPTPAALATPPVASAPAVSPSPSPRTPTAELRLVVVSGTPEPTPAPAAPMAAPAVLTAAPGPAAAVSTLPPPLTGVSADDLPQPIPLEPGRVSMAPVRAAATAPAAPRTDPASIMAAMKLDGIIFDKRDPVAMIDGRMVRPGATIGSARVVRILQDSVILRIDGAEYSLGQ